MTKRRDEVLIIGTGGHSRFVTSTLIEANVSIKGIISLDNNYNPKEKIISHNIIGNIDDTLTLYKKGFHKVVLAVGNNSLRKDLFNKLKNKNFLFPNIVHPSCFIDVTAKIEEGNIIGPKAVIGADVTIGSNNIINSSSVIEHESKVGNHSHIAPGVVVCGRVSLGDEVMMGANSTAIDNISISCNTIVGAGSTVIKSCSLKNVTLAGSPAKRIK